MLSDSPVHVRFIILTLLNQGQQVRLLHRLGDTYALCGTLGVDSGWDLLHQTQTEYDISLKNEYRLGDMYALCETLGVDSGWDLLHQT